MFSSRSNVVPTRAEYVLALMASARCPLSSFRAVTAVVVPLGGSAYGNFLERNTLKMSQHAAGDSDLQSHVVVLG